MITTVYFDWGGVLASGGHSFWKTVQEKMGVTIDEKDAEAFKLLRIGLNTGTLTEIEFAQSLQKLTGVAVPDTIWQMEEVINILPQMQEFALELKARGYKIGILSNMNRAMVVNIKEAGGYDPFSIVVNSCEVGCMKPDQKIYDLALARADEKPEKIIFIDDLEANLVYPASIGVKTILGLHPRQIINDVNMLLG